MIRVVEWLRFPGNIVFIALGVAPMVIATGLTYKMIKETSTG